MTSWRSYNLDNIVVRKISLNEILQVREIFQEIFSTKDFGNTPIFEKATAGEEIYVAVMNNEIIGFASMWEPDYFIHYLGVLKSARHKKVGSILINSIAKIYNRQLTLKCLLKNKEGLAFYEATGWEKIEDGMSDDGEYVLLKYEV